jgi:hypothetical protein
MRWKRFLQIESTILCLSAINSISIHRESPGPTGVCVQLTNGEQFTFYSISFDDLANILATKIDGCEVLEIGEL